MGTSPSREARRQWSSGLAASNVLCIPHRAAPFHGYRSIQAPQCCCLCCRQGHTRWWRHGSEDFYNEAEGGDPRQCYRGHHRLVLKPSHAWDCQPHCRLPTVSLTIALGWGTLPMDATPGSRILPLHHSPSRHCVPSRCLATVELVIAARGPST